MTERGWQAAINAPSRRNAPIPVPYKQGESLEQKDVPEPDDSHMQMIPEELIPIRSDMDWPPAWRPVPIYAIEELSKEVETLYEALEHFMGMDQPKNQYEHRAVVAEKERMSKIRGILQHMSPPEPL